MSPKWKHKMATFRGDIVSETVSVQQHETSPERRDFWTGDVAIWLNEPGPRWRPIWITHYITVGTWPECMVRSEALIGNITWESQDTTLYYGLVGTKLRTWSDTLPERPLSPSRGLPGILYGVIYSHSGSEQVQTHNYTRP